MREQRHLRLVESPVERSRGPLGLLEGPPWSWLALVAATVVTPAIQSVSKILSAYEADTPQGVSEPLREYTPWQKQF